MMGGSSLWPQIASLAAQGAPGEAPAPAPLPAAEQPAAGEPSLDELAPPPPPADWQEAIGDDLATQILAGRRRPGYNPILPDRLTQDNEGALRPPPPEAFPGIEDQLPVPDRWRLIETLGVVKELWFDPYHQNTLKGDRPIDRSKVKLLPIMGDDWFFVANLISVNAFEPRTCPYPNVIPHSPRTDSRTWLH